MYADAPPRLAAADCAARYGRRPVIAVLDTALGHGSFISRIVRQVAPDATVLSVRIMHPDDIVYEGDLTMALGLLAARVAEAQDPADPKPELMIDAVSLSLGYFNESPADVAYTRGCGRCSTRCSTGAL